ncbi:cache domain-containing protein [Cryobacterium cryoconiti]|uniref:Cache domain-containing protein n=1 Tax=Cryobacterium cryoconiti TaxID=1259239 RepID=A0A4Y8JW68_9MICO|nr:cache domain-containing protein [Cryobacterium cryoconiti]TFD29543.1 hypothetical protein E3T49_08930 [Cryobacterium cryoconiti]
MTTGVTTVASRAVAAVDGYFADALDALEAWRLDIAGDIAAARRSGPVTTSRLDALVAPYARQTLDTPGISVYGAGFIAAYDSLADAPSHLAWWQGPQRARLTLANQAINKGNIDYSELEWYRVPLLTGEAHIAGPYVDYLCSDEYTITVAAPVRIDDVFVGVTGLDLLIDTVERDLTPRLALLGADITIVNTAGRVVVSTNHRLATGESLRGDAYRDTERVPCLRTPLEIVLV